MSLDERVVLQRGFSSVFADQCRPERVEIVLPLPGLHYGLGKVLGHGRICLRVGKNDAAVCFLPLFGAECFMFGQKCIIGRIRFESVVQQLASPVAIELYECLMKICEIVLANAVEDFF